MVVRQRTRTIPWVKCPAEKTNFTEVDAVKCPAENTNVTVRDAVKCPAEKTNFSVGDAVKCPAETECLYCCPVPFNSRGTGVRTAHSSHSEIICRTTTTRSRDHQLSSAGLPLPGHVIINYHLQHYPLPGHQLSSAELPLPDYLITN